MWISSFVVTLADTPEAHEQVPAALRSIACLELGESCASLRLPVVLETDDAEASRYWYEWIERLPGVLKVDLAFVTFESIDEDNGIPLPVLAAAEAVDG